MDNFAKGLSEWCRQMSAKAVIYNEWGERTSERQLCDGYKIKISRLNGDLPEGAGLGIFLGRLSWPYKDSAKYQVIPKNHEGIELKRSWENTIVSGSSQEGVFSINIRIGVPNPIKPIGVDKGTQATIKTADISTQWEDILHINKQKETASQYVITLNEDDAKTATPLLEDTTKEKDDDAKIITPLLDDAKIVTPVLDDVKIVTPVLDDTIKEIDDAKTVTPLLEDTNEKNMNEAENILSEMFLQEDSIDLLLGDEDKLFENEEKDQMVNMAEEENIFDSNPFEKDKGELKFQPKILEKKDNSSDDNITNSIKKDEEKIKCNLWLSGLQTSTKAHELRTLFSKHGKVLSVKIVATAKNSTGSCFGFITMVNREAAERCVSNIDQTEVNGRTIQVKITEGELSDALKASQKNLNKDEDEEISDSSNDKNALNNTNESQLSYSRSRSRSQERFQRVSAKTRIGNRRQNKVNNEPKSPRKLFMNSKKIDNEGNDQRQPTHEQYNRKTEQHKIIAARFHEKRQKELQELKIEREREKVRLVRERIETEKQPFQRKRALEREDMHQQVLTNNSRFKRGRVLSRGDSQAGRNQYRSKWDTSGGLLDMPSSTPQSFRDVPTYNRFEGLNRNMASLSRGNAGNRWAPRGRTRVLMNRTDSTNQSFRERSPMDSRYSTRLLNQPLSESWQMDENGPEARRSYGAASSAPMSSQLASFGRTGNESQGEWCDYSNQRERWSNNSSNAGRNGKPLLGLMDQSRYSLMDY